MPGIFLETLSNTTDSPSGFEAAGLSCLYTDCAHQPIRPYGTLGRDAPLAVSDRLLPVRVLRKKKGGAPAKTNLDN